MKQIPPIPLKDKYWPGIQKEIEITVILDGNEINIPGIREELFNDLRQFIGYEERPKNTPGYWIEVTGIDSLLREYVSGLT